MRILALDTATEVCGVALWMDERLPVEVMLHHGQTHARYLMEAVHSTLALGGVPLEEIDGLAVTQGPGSFTGLRVGISTAKGLALAAAKPLVGVSTLHALAAQAEWEGEWVCPMIDARRREVYWALYRRSGADLVMVEPEQAGPPALVLDRIDRPCAFIGSGAWLYRDALAGNAHANLATIEARHRLRPGSVAQLAARRLRCGRTENLDSFGPFYLRASDAEKNRPPS